MGFILTFTYNICVTISLFLSCLVGN